VDQVVDGSCRAYCQPQLHQQAKVIRRYVWVGTPYDLALLQPLFTDRPKDAQGSHGLARVEDVVDDALEVECVVGVGHQFW